MSETYYALDRFGLLGRNLSGIIEAMPIKRRAVDIYTQKKNVERARQTYSELEAQKEKLLSTVRELQLLFSECEMTDLAEYSKTLYGAVTSFNLLTKDYTKLMSAIGLVYDRIPKNETANAAVVGRLMNNIKMGYYPTDNEHVKMLKNSLKFPDGKVNVLDPCCGCGLALQTLTNGENAVTYGIELDENRGKEAETQLDRVGFGSFFHSRTSCGAFHALFLNPPYLSVISEGGTKARSEKRFLVESMPKLMTGGVMMYIIPYYRLTYDICRVLCDNFNNISVYRFLSGEFEKFKQIVVIGVKKKKEDGSKQAEKLSEYAMLPDRIPVIDTLENGRYVLPNTEKKVELFKGAVFNLGELKRQMADSKSINTLFEKSRIDAEEKRPLLPLNTGQVGLIGGSGLINGYVDCDSPHIIKGRIIKEIKRREVDDGIIAETRVNRMVFNILTPDGLKKL